MTMCVNAAWRSLLALTAGLLLGACGDKPAPAPPIRLGVIVDVSGPSASLGIAGRNGMQLAVEEANASGGIQGRPIELLFRDDGFNVAQAEQAARELIAEQVLAVLGPMTSTIAEQLAPQFTEAGILLMGGTPLSPLLAGRDDQFFRILSHANPDARDIASYLQRHYGRQRINVLIELSNHSYTRPWLADFSQHLRAAGGEIGLTVEFNRDPQTDFAGLAQAALADQPKAVVLISNALDTALLATQLRLRDPQLVLATPAWAAADALPEMGGRAVEGIITAQAFDMNDQSSAFLDFAQRYRARFGQAIDTAAVTSYNATQVLLSALQQSLPGESPKQALLRIRQFQGLQHPIIFDDFGDSESRLYPMVIRDGRFSSLE
ncbi:ABC transporter substrate-binding protein [Pseudomonas sp.]|uniref:ABC transporter substrate-binding protein n=1 Tax=Pseudomonas sp. TaxID=306 RepID=UPI002734D4A2|nr:ABC transporter substrate-binding protein [Pseudomonas sp.]MDP3813831.1 ABC transporter substrate-binding protein [Pseudomonas sp.]